MKDGERQRQSSCPGSVVSPGLQASFRPFIIPLRPVQVEFPPLCNQHVLTSSCSYLSSKLFPQVWINTSKQVVLKLPREHFVHVPQRGPAWLGDSLCSHSLFSRIIQIIKQRRGWIPGFWASAWASRSTISSPKLTSNTAFLCHTRTHRAPWP